MSEVQDLMGRGERERNDITPNPGSSDLAFCSDNSSEGNKKVFLFFLIQGGVFPFRVSVRQRQQRLNFQFTSIKAVLVTLHFISYQVELFQPLLQEHFQ